MRPIAAPKNLERTIAARSTTQAKYWNNPTGWLNTIKHLKGKGYRVINYHVCNGCWNDGAISFVHDDFDWCPRTSTPTASTSAPVSSPPKRSAASSTS